LNFKLLIHVREKRKTTSIWNVSNYAKCLASALILYDCKHFQAFLQSLNFWVLKKMNTD
jgi:hypothetical protein